MRAHVPRVDGDSMQAKVRYCKECDTEVDEEVTVCPECGHILETVVTTHRGRRHGRQKGEVTRE